MASWGRLKGVNTEFVVDVRVIFGRVFACLVNEIARAASAEEEEKREEEGVGRNHVFHYNG